MTFHIQLKGEATPVYCGNHWRFASKKFDCTKEQLDMLQSAGIIQKRGADYEGLSSVTFPPKKGGDLRFWSTNVVLNNAAAPDWYLLPKADEFWKNWLGTLSIRQLTDSVGIMPWREIKNLFH